MVRSRDAELNTKLPPVEDERVITTLVAFTVSASAAEPEAITKSIAGEVRERVVLADQFSGAASAELLAPKVRSAKTPRASQLILS